MTRTKMQPPQIKARPLEPNQPQRVPHLHDGFIVVKVGFVQSTTAPAHITQPQTQRPTTNPGARSLVVGDRGRMKFREPTKLHRKSGIWGVVGQEP